jgi:hypothetical protein
MLNSTRRGISYPNPDRSDRPDIPAHILQLVNALEVDVMYVQGTDAARIAAVHMAGVLWRTTDTLQFWWDTGSVWLNLSPGVLFNTYANRPVANTVPAGTRFYATDTYGLFYSDGATWTLLSQGRPRVTPANFALAPFSTPYDNQEVALIVDATNGINWSFKYNAGSGSAYKWESIGSEDPMFAEVTTGETRANVAYGDLTTVGPSIVLPRDGDYDVEVAFNAASVGNTNNPSYMSYAIGATAAQDTESAIAPCWGLAQPLGTYSLKRRKTGLLAANTLQAKYKDPGGAIGTSFSRRRMFVYPVRIS